MTMVLLLGLVSSAPAMAQNNADRGGSSYITPFPKNDIYKLRAYGDYFAEGISYGLADAFKGDRRVQLLSNYGRIRSIVRRNFSATLKRHLDRLSQAPIQIAVIMMGGDDRARIRFPDGASLKLHTPAWRRAYARRIDQLIKGFRDKGVAVYWVSMPILRRPRANQMAKFINEIIRERVYLNGARFIDVYSAFANEQGDYDRYGPDLTGKIKKLRDRDGETFTAAGNRKLAHFVAGEIKRDLAQAKADRAVPLAGSKEDQQRINPERRLAAAALEKGWQSSVTEKATRRGKGGDRQQRHRRRAARRRTLAQQADNGKVSLHVAGPDGKIKTIAVELPRPAIAAAVIAMVTRKQSVSRPSDVGDAVPGILQGGLTILNTITPAHDNFGNGRHRRLPPTHTLYYRVLIKGETLRPKPGRSDDFRWPRAGMKAARAQPDAQNQDPQSGNAQNRDNASRSRKRARTTPRRGLPRG